MLQRITILITAFTLLSSEGFSQPNKKPVSIKPQGNSKPQPVQMVQAPPPPPPAPLPPLKKLNDKLDYAFIMDKKLGTTPKEGDVIRLHMMSACNNRMMYSSAMNNGGKPVEFSVNKPSFKGDIINAILLMTPGDSLVASVDAYDVFKNINKDMPDFVKKGDKMQYYVKLISIKSAAEVQKEQQAKFQKQMKEQQAKQEAELKKQLLADDKKLKAYFKTNQIEPIKKEKGTYFMELKQGSGPMAKKNDRVKIKFTGRLTDGTKFNSNVDSNGNVTQAMELIQGSGQLNAQLDEHLTMMNKGSEMRLFIPSVLGYGKYEQPQKMGFQKGVPPNSNLIFDVEVLDIAEPVNEDDAIQQYFKERNITDAVKTASGMYYRMTSEGSGDVPASGDTTVMNYSGYLLDGTPFDSNVDTSFHHVQPFEFPLGAGRVIKGWDEGVALLKKGSKATFFIPSSLGYGQAAQRKIPAFSTLLFDVELVEIKKKR